MEQVNIHKNVLHIMRTSTVEEIVRTLHWSKIILAFAVFAAFSASLAFVLKYFVAGTLDYSIWTVEEWWNAKIAFSITGIISISAGMLYGKGYRGLGAIMFFVCIAFFGFFSEVSQSMEREDVTVRARSMDSPAMKAAIKAAENAGVSTSIPGALSLKLDRASKRAVELQTRIDNKNSCKSCEPETFKNLRQRLARAKGNLAAVEAQIESHLSIAVASAGAVTNNAITQIKQLEYDEDKHYAMIRLIKRLFGTTGIWASFLFAVIIIGTFEYAFHFIGSYVAHHKQALFLMGRDAKGEPVDTLHTVNIDELLQTKYVSQASLGALLKAEFTSWIMGKVSRDGLGPVQADDTDDDYDEGDTKDERELIHRVYKVVVRELSNGELRSATVRRGSPLFKLVKDEVGGSNELIATRIKRLMRWHLIPEEIVIPKNLTVTPVQYILNPYHPAVRGDAYKVKGISSN